MDKRSRVFDGRVLKGYTRQCTYLRAEAVHWITAHLSNGHLRPSKKVLALFYLCCGIMSLTEAS